MKLERPEKNISVIDTLDEAQFGISTADQSHIVSILRDKLYSDKVMAVLREYSTNAIDAHVEKGIADEPIKVHLPTTESPMLSIRDYGIGLSEDQIKNVYIQYGASSKRGSNEAIGQLGLGCKSAFAYTDSFTIISFYDGVKTIYRAYIDETDMGKIQKMSQEPTTQRSGIEIRVDVKSWDIKEFITKARKLFQHFTVIPDHNGDFTSSRDKFIEGTGWYLPVNNEDSTLAIMGHIAYEIRDSALWSHPDHKTNISEILYAGLVIDFNIGELDISASRESLEYKERTIKNIISKIEIVGKELHELLTLQMEAQPSNWAAVKKYKLLRQQTSYEARDLIPTTWRGQELNKELIFKSSDHLKFAILRRHSSTRSLIHKSSRIILESLDAILINDVSIAPVKRALALRTSNKYSNMLILSETDQAKIDILIGKYGLTGIPIHRLSTIDYERSSNQVNGQSHTEAIAKQSDYIFQLTNAAVHKGWAPCEVDTNSVQIYTPVFRFQVDIPGIDNYIVKYLLKELEKITGEKPTLYGIRKNKLAKTPKSWIRVDTYIMNKLQEFVDNHMSKILYIKLSTALTRSFYGSFACEAGSGASRFSSRLHRIFCIRNIAVGDLVRNRVEIIERQMNAHYNVASYLSDYEDQTDNTSDITDPIIKQIYKDFPLVGAVRKDNNSINDLFKYATLMEQDRCHQASLS